MGVNIYLTRVDFPNDSLSHPSLSCWVGAVYVYRKNSPKTLVTPNINFHDFHTFFTPNGSEVSDFKDWRNFGLSLLSKLLLGSKFFCIQYERPPAQQGDSLFPDMETTFYSDVVSKAVASTLEYFLPSSEQLPLQIHVFMTNDLFNGESGRALTKALRQQFSPYLKANGKSAKFRFGQQKSEQTIFKILKKLAFLIANDNTIRNNKTLLVARHRLCF